VLRDERVEKTGSQDEEKEGQAEAVTLATLILSGVDSVFLGVILWLLFKRRGINGS